MNAIRPDPVLERCPDGHTMCFPWPEDPSLEQLEHTICVREGMEEECPITGITFNLTEVPAELIGSYN